MRKSQNKRIAARTYLLGLLAVAVIIGCGSGGSSGPSGPPNPSGEVALRYCRVIEIANEMHLQWDADCKTRGEFRYGQTTYTSQIGIQTLADSQDVVLTGLTFNMHYIYRLTVFDSLQRSAECSGEFTTPAKATPEPVITGLAMTNITECTALVSWRTDEPATTVLYYGSPTASDSLVTDSLVMQHSVMLMSLNPSTTYQIRPEAVDSTNLRGYGRDTTFATAARMIVWFPDTSVALGDTIQLPIYVTDAVDLAALRIGIGYAPGSVEVVRVTEGPFYTDHRGFIFFSNIRNASGELYSDLTWSINYAGNQRTGTDADGSGIVAYAAVRGLSPGGADVHFLADSSFALDVFANARTCSLHVGTLTVLP